MQRGAWVLSFIIGSGGRGNPSAGFTLIEMLVVITIMAMVAALAVPVLSHPSSTLTLETTAQDLAGALRLTRARAIAQNVDIAFEIDTDRHTFQSAATPSHSFAPGVDAKLRVAEPEQTSPFRGAFRFFPDGTSSGGDILLRLGDKQARICVSWLTGEARRGDRC
jgi:general secretion pathway protein H